MKLNSDSLINDSGLNQMFWQQNRNLFPVYMEPAESSGFLCAAHCWNQTPDQQPMGSINTILGEEGMYQ